MAGEYRVIVAGSRGVSNREAVFAILDRELACVPIPEGSQLIIVSGGAAGVDSLAGAYAREREIRLEEYPISEADWNQYGKSAGPRRNGRMAGVGDFLIAVWDGRSPGTRNMIAQMRRRGRGVAVVSPPSETWGYRDK